MNKILKDIEIQLAGEKATGRLHEHGEKIYNLMRSLFIENNEKLKKEFQNEMTWNTLNYIIYHNNHYTGIELQGSQVAIKFESYHSGETEFGFEYIDIEIFIMDDGPERNAKIIALVDAKYNAMREKFIGAPKIAAANKEAQERQEYEKLKEKYERK